MDIISELKDFMIRQRHSGTTTLVKKIVEDNDVWVLVAKDEDRREFNSKKAIPITQLEYYRPADKKPIIFDNHAIFRLIEIADKQREDILEENKTLRIQRQKLFDLLSNSNSELINCLRTLQIEDYEVDFQTPAEADEMLRSLKSLKK